MNYFEYKTGKLIINNTECELTKIESEILRLLVGNKLRTYTEIYNRIYKVNVLEIDKENKKSIITHICRMRKKGLNISTKYNYGMKLLDKIVLM